MEKREYIAAINNIAKELEENELKAVYEMALICKANRKEKRKKEVDTDDR